MIPQGGVRRPLLLRRTSRAVIAAALVGMSSCSAKTEVQPRSEIRILAGPLGGGYRSLTSELVREYARGFPSVDFTLVERRPEVSDVEQIQHGEADLGMTLADVAYRAFAGQYKSGLTFSQLRAISALDVTPLHLVVRADSGIRGIGDLRGHSVGMNVPISESRTVAELVLDAFGVDLQSIRAQRYSPVTAGTKFAAGEVDAILYPLAYPAESVIAATKAGGRLVPIEGKPIQRLLQDHTFLQLARIPGGIYPGNADSVRTIGVATVLLCRSDLDEGLVYQLTRQFFEILPGATASLGPLRFMDLEHAPATPIPLHDGAARYYRERKLLR